MSLTGPQQLIQDSLIERETRSTRTITQMEHDMNIRALNDRTRRQRLNPPFVRQPSSSVRRRLLRQRGLRGIQPAASAVVYTRNRNVIPQPSSSPRPSPFVVTLEDCWTYVIFKDIDIEKAKKFNLVLNDLDCINATLDTILLKFPEVKSLVYKHFRRFYFCRTTLTMLGHASRDRLTREPIHYLCACVKSVLEDAFRSPWQSGLTLRDIELEKQVLVKIEELYHSKIGVVPSPPPVALDLSKIDEYCSSQLQRCDVCFEWNVPGLMYLHKPYIREQGGCKTMICIDCYIHAPKKYKKKCPVCQQPSSLHITQLSESRRIISGMESLLKPDQKRPLKRDCQCEYCIQPRSVHGNDYTLFHCGCDDNKHNNNDIDWLSCDKHPWKIIYVNNGNRRKIRRIEPRGSVSSSSSSVRLSGLAAEEYIMRIPEESIRRYSRDSSSPMLLAGEGVQRPSLNEEDDDEDEARYSEFVHSQTYDLIRSIINSTPAHQHLLREYLRHVMMLRDPILSDLSGLRVSTHSLFQYLCRMHPDWSEMLNGLQVSIERVERPAVAEEEKKEQPEEEEEDEEDADEEYESFLHSQSSDMIDSINNSPLTDQDKLSDYLTNVRFLRNHVDLRDGSFMWRTTSRYEELLTLHPEWREMLNGLQASIGGVEHVRQPPSPESADEEEVIDVNPAQSMEDEIPSSQPGEEEEEEEDDNTLTTEEWVEFLESQAGVMRHFINMSSPTHQSLLREYVYALREDQPSVGRRYQELCRLHPEWTDMLYGLNHMVPLSQSSLPPLPEYMDDDARMRQYRLIIIEYLSEPYADPCHGIRRSDLLRRAESLYHELYSRHLGWRARLRELHDSITQPPPEVELVPEEVVDRNYANDDERMDHFRVLTVMLSRPADTPRRAIVQNVESLYISLYYRHPEWRGELTRLYSSYT